MPTTLERTPVESQIFAKVLLDSGHSLAQVMKQCQLSKGTIIGIKRNNEYSATQLDEFKRRLPFKAYRLADNVLDLISLDEIKKAPLGTKMMAFGVAIDKARDMEGSNRPVFNVVTVVNECKQAMSRLDGDIGTLQSALGRKQIEATQLTVGANER